MQATLQRAVGLPTALVSLCCTFQRAVLAALCDAGVCLFLLLNVVYLPIYAKVGLVVGMTKQISNGKEVDIVNC